MVSLHNRIIYGVSCHRTTFWKTTGEQRVVCGADINHPVPETAKFCGECAAMTKVVNIEAPAERFGHVCMLAKEDPGHVFNALRVGGWEWSSDDEKNIKLLIGWTSASSFVSAEEESDENMVIGVVVGSDSPDPKYSPRMLVVDPTALQIYQTAMNEVAIALGLVDRPALYFQTNVSF